MAAPPGPSSAIPLTAEVPRFGILGILGTGAQGVVVLAHDYADAHSEPLGLKILKGRASGESAALVRLREEAKILAWLQHPNIVRVHRLLEKDGFPIVVMEYVEGASALEQMIRQREGLPPAVAVEIARATALALEAAYNAPGPDGQPMRIVHRDVKPANLLVSIKGEVKVVDFGVATGTFEQGPQGGQFMGTPGYVAPERWAGAPDTPAVDVYGLGATLFGMLTGKKLVQSKSVIGHDPSIGRALAHLAPQGLPGSTVWALRELIADMCRFHVNERPTLLQLVQRFDGLSAILGRPDMKAYAEEQVGPILDARRQVKPKEHPDWGELAFLERGGSVQDLSIETPGPKRGLALRDVEGPADVDPLIATLEEKPRWSFWTGRKDPEKLAGALIALRGTRDARAVTLAHQLTHHPDPRVAEAAWELLAAAC